MRMWICLMLAAVAIPAHAHGPRHNWAAVANLPVGERVELRDTDTGDVRGCIVAAVTATTLTCETSGSFGPASRVVYPKGSVDRVWTASWYPGSGWRLRVLHGIAVGLGTCLIAAIPAGPLGCGLAGPVGFLLGAWWWDVPEPPPVMHRKLIYKTG